MRCSFWPRDRDRMTERMEGVCMGFGPLWRGVGLQHTRGLYGSPVNRWSIKQTPNGTKFDMRSTGSVPRPLDKSWSILRMFDTRSRKETKGSARGNRSAGLQNGQRGNARMHETNTYANAMHMMT